MLYIRAVRPCSFILFCSVLDASVELHVHRVSSINPVTLHRDQNNTHLAVPWKNVCDSLRVNGAIV